VRFTSQSLSARLTLYYALAFALLLGLMFAVLYASLTRVFSTQADEDLVGDIAEFSSFYDELGIEGVEHEIDIETQGAEAETSFLKVFDRKGMEIISSDAAHWQGLEIGILKALTLKTGDQPVLETISLETQEADTRMVFGAISDQHLLVIGESLEERDDIMEILSTAFVLVFLVALPLILLLIWLLTRRAVRGIRHVSDVANDITRGQLGRRVNATGEVSEVQALADTFDGMADRIQSLIRNMHNMTDNIAHDLRSPLARIRILAETSLDQSTDTQSVKRIAENTIVECDRLTQMINTSLDVAEAEAGVARVQHDTLEIHSVIEDVCELYHPLAEQNSIEFDYELAGDCELIGDTTSIQRMLSNLLDNAIKYTPQGGSIDVTLQCLAYHVNIMISNNGPGIDPEHQQHIFNRFFRIDQSRATTGSGLGLSYARAVARSHGGDISVFSEPNENTVFSITLPCQFVHSDLITPKTVTV